VLHDLRLRDLASRLPHHDRHRYLPCLFVRIPANSIEYQYSARACGDYNFILAFLLELPHNCSISNFWGYLIICHILVRTLIICHTLYALW
jgi:hypothetical protein